MLPRTVPVLVVFGFVSGVRLRPAGNPLKRNFYQDMGYAVFSVVEGAQAVAAMVCCTQTMPTVDLNAVPGNTLAAESKSQLFSAVGIGFLLRPVEVFVADDYAGLFPVASCLLSQSEHGPDILAVLITTLEKVGIQSIKWSTSC